MRLKHNCFHIHNFSLLIVCPAKFPQIELHPQRPNHGDVCRKSPQNRNYRCPKGCFKTRGGGRPFCQMSPSNKAPCRLVCQDRFVLEIPNDSQYGSLCREDGSRNYRCPRGCRKTRNAPFCVKSWNRSQPCRKQEPPF